MKSKFLVLLTLFLAFVLCLTLASCGDSKGDDDEDEEKKNEGEVSEKTWNKYFELKNCVAFELGYSISTASTVDGVETHADSTALTYSFRNNSCSIVLEYDSPISDRVEEYHPESLMDLPFYTAVTDTFDTDELNFDFDSYTFNKKTKSYVFETDFSHAGIDYTAKITVIFKNDVLHSVQADMTNTHVEGESVFEESVTEIFEFSSFEFSKSDSSFGEGADTPTQAPDPNEVTRENWDNLFNLATYPAFTVDYSSSKNLSDQLYPSFTYEYSNGSFSYTTESNEAAVGEYYMTHILDLPYFISENTSLSELSVFNSGILNFDNYVYDGTFYNYEYTRYTDTEEVYVTVSVLFNSNQISEICIQQAYYSYDSFSYSTTDSFIFHDFGH